MSFYKSTHCDYNFLYDSDYLWFPTFLQMWHSCPSPLSAFSVLQSPMSAWQSHFERPFCIFPWRAPFGCPAPCLTPTVPRRMLWWSALPVKDCGRKSLRCQLLSISLQPSENANSHVHKPLLKNVMYYISGCFSFIAQLVDLQVCCIHLIALQGRAKKRIIQHFLKWSTSCAWACKWCNIFWRKFFQSIYQSINS